jgi:hypothetical protein
MSAAPLRDRLAAIVSAMATSRMPPVKEWRFDEAGARLPRGGRRLQEGEDYVGVRLDGLHLAAGRQWWSTYDPLVYVEVEFQYGRERISVPRLLGPAVMKRQLPGGLEELPHGFSIRNLPVVGAIPYRGGPVVLTLVLYKTRHTNYSRAMLSFLETLSSATAVGGIAGPALQFGRVLTDAVDALFHMGETVPIVGHQVGLNVTPGEGLRAQTVALVSGEADEAGACVADGRLRRGDRDDFDAFDHAVYTVWGSASPSPEAVLAFNPAFDRMNDEAALGTDESWQRAKAMLMAAYPALTASPDLLAPDAERLFAAQRDRIKRTRDVARETTMMSIGREDGRDGSKALQRLDEVTRGLLDL